MRSWSEHPCHGTCVVLNATSAQNRLVGNAVWSVHSRIASASIRNITSPRKASIDVMRLVVGATVDAGRTSVSVESIALMKAFYACGALREAEDWPVWLGLL